MNKKLTWAAVFLISACSGSKDEKKPEASHEDQFSDYNYDYDPTEHGGPAYNERSPVLGGRNPRQEPLADMTRDALTYGRDVDLAEKADRSVERMVSLSTFKLKKSGYRELALNYETEYYAVFHKRITMMVTARLEGRLGDIGDYAPMSEFLVRLDQDLTRRLGPKIMAFTHLEDIRIINYTIPVVFNFESIPDEAISPAEYKKHFVPFGGVVAYWGVSIFCDVATWGTGYWIVCTPAGLLAKYATINYIAPPMYPRWYEFFYPREF